MTSTTTLDDIITRHAAPKTKAGKLRPFTPADWAGYAGCETEKPEIADHSWGDVILDGCAVGCSMLLEDDAGELVDTAEFCATFPTEAAARLIAETIRTPGDVNEYLGEPVN